MNEWLVRGLALAAGLLATPAALACGGLFCGAPPPTPAPPQPVDQNAERIIFTVEGGQTTAHVQIQYAGGADDFAWIVPVPGVPGVAESTTELFAALDEQTRFDILLPPADPCPVPSSGGGGGVGCADSAVFASEGGGGGLGSPRDASPVTVYAQDVTDNFEFAVIGAEKTSDLVKWLQEFGYNVSDNMTGVIDPYNGPDGRFLALKLRDGKQASDIVPIAMTFESSRPIIPIQLTRVAAQPLMGILVFIVADTPFSPANYEAVDPATEHLLFDEAGNTNYFEWVARAATEAEGKRFVREYVGSNPLDGAVFGDLTLRGAVVSRYYTRMSPWHMTVDPEFEADADAPQRQTRVLDLSAKQTLWNCFSTYPERAPSPCAFNYCGKDAECAVVDGEVGCICPTGQVAQRISGPDGTDHVTCAPADNPFGITDVAGGAGSEFDPCNSYPCGEGECVLKGGFPTCSCVAGTVACLEPGGQIACMLPPVPPTTFGPGAGAESAAQASSAAAPRAERQRFALSWWAPVLVALLGLWAWRRRSRLRAPT